MASDMRQMLINLEQFLTESVKANYWLTPNDIAPNSIARHLLDELARKRFIWVGNETYVPNKIVVKAPNPTPEKLEEYEVLFNSVVFMKYLYDYITGSGFKLFAPITVEIKGYVTEDRQKTCSLVFEWPTPEDSNDDVTVKVDESEGRILEVTGRQPQIPRLARLSAMSGHVYRTPYVITRKSTYLGRLRNVLDKQTGEILRRNDFVFSRLDDDNSPNSSVSRQHATIVFEDGEFFLYDTGSANGTSVERAGEALEVARNNPSGVLLMDGDIIRLGTALVRVDLDPDVSETNFGATTGSLELTTPVEDSSESLTTVRVSRQEIEAEMRKVLESE